MMIKKLFTTAITLMYAGFAFSAVSPEEAAKLGVELTEVGAIKAGNEEGTIPPFTGGLKELPEGFQEGNGIRPNPFSSERPLFSIDASNMAEYQDKLTEGTKALMEKFSDFRIDVYPTHRTSAFPQYILDNTKDCAVTSETYNNGLSMKGCHAGIPFPIPKTGFEAMWNHLTRFQGRSAVLNFEAYYVNPNGSRVLTSGGTYSTDFPYYDENPQSDLFSRVKSEYKMPRRRNGETIMVHDALNPTEQGRRAYIYLPAQRRVKLAPSVNFDTPNPSLGGYATYDDTFIFFGSMERFDFELVGRKEMFVPYNTYDAAYHVTADELLTANHLNPDHVRWELHRVWEVEATLRDDSRHLYSKRTFYIDEDSWVAVASDQYDQNGELYRPAFALMTPSYEVPASFSDNYVIYDLNAGVYAINFWTATHGGVRYVDPQAERAWSPSALSGSGLR